MTSFVPPGVVRALALDGVRLLVLVAEGGSRRVEVRALPSGNLLRVLDVPATAADELSLSGRRAVYRIARSISLVDVDTGDVRDIATAARPPVGLSIEGKRIAWAEQGRRSRIRALTAP